MKNDTLFGYTFLDGIYFLVVAFVLAYALENHWGFLPIFFSVAWIIQHFIWTMRVDNIYEVRGMWMVRMFCLVIIGGAMTIMFLLPYLFPGMHR
jgi:hypothetical protein